MIYLFHSFVLSVFGLTERSVRFRMPRPFYLYHSERLTGGGFGLPNPTDGGLPGPFRVRHPSTLRKNPLFPAVRLGEGRILVSALLNLKGAY